MNDEGLRFFLAIDRSIMSEQACCELVEWQQTHNDRVELFDLRFRPDLGAHLHISTTPCIVAYFDIAKPLPSQYITSLNFLEDYYRLLLEAWIDHRDSVVQLAEPPRKTKAIEEAQSTTISTLLVREWLKRVEQRPISRDRMTLDELRLVSTIVRFRERPGAVALLEHIYQRIALLQIDQLPLSYLCETILATASIYLSVSAFPNCYTLQNSAICETLQHQADHLLTKLDAATGLYFPTYATENKIRLESTTITEQAQVVRALVRIGWAFGSVWIRHAGNLIDSVYRYGRFSTDGAELELPSNDNLGFRLSDGLVFAIAALDYYRYSGDSRWLGRIETIAAIWFDRFRTTDGQLDWFSKGHILHGSVPALHEQGLFAILSLELGRITQNDYWDEIADSLLSPIGRNLLEFPRESVSLVEGMIRIFSHDLTVVGPWQCNDLPVEWRVAIAPWLPDLRIDWQSKSASVAIQIGKQSFELEKPISLYRILSHKN